MKKGGKNIHGTNMNNFTSKPAKTAFALAAIFTLFIAPAKADTPEPDISCLDSIEAALDSLGQERSARFCEEYRDGWRFSLERGVGHNGSLTSGTILELFTFRQPNWKEGEANTLSFSLTPYDDSAPNLFRIDIIHNGEPDDGGSRFRYFLWGRDMRTDSNGYSEYGNRWNPVRLLRCLDTDNGRCVTYYHIIVCRDYRHPGLLYPPNQDRLEPVLVISTTAPEYNRDLLLNYDQAVLIAEELQERLLEYSCQ